MGHRIHLDGGTETAEIISQALQQTTVA